MRPALAAALIALFSAGPGRAHRLDEYLQATIVSVEKSRVQMQITLTPGVIVFPFLIDDIDTNRDGVVSRAEQGAYAGSVLRDLSIAIDGHSLTPHLLSAEFPSIGEMKDGRGQIRLEFDTGLPSGGRERKLTFENRHQRRISVYQVNCLAPRDSDTRIVSQNRNYSQSHYELEFVREGAVPLDAGILRLPGPAMPLGMLALALCGRLLLLRRRGLNKP